MVEHILPLALDEAVVRKRGKTLVGPVSVQLEGAGFTIVMGANGSGKTSLLRMINGLERLAEGSVTWNCDRQEAHHKQAFVLKVNYAISV